ncbi:MAG: TraB/GumN family protein, partial [Stenotrophomonas sp.]|nr:TraB/GumN family protein [Stenotrophomonas sp.]
MQHGRNGHWISCGFTLALLLCAPLSVAAQAVTAEGPVVDMAAVQVTGEQPGPGLWKVSNAQGHVLWLLGTVAPLPAGVTWRSDQVQQVIAASDHVLGPPGWTPDVKLGLLRGLTLLPLAMKTAKDPQGRTLQHWLDGPQPLCLRPLQRGGASRQGHPRHADPSQDDHGVRRDRIACERVCDVR